MSCNPATPEDIFTCRQCGDCCQGFGGTYVSDEDIQAIAAFIHSEPDVFIRTCCRPSGKKRVLGQAENGYCLFWENRICTIHPVKPRMCRAWPFIPGVLRDPGNWYAMAGSCPGMRPDVSPEGIAACVREEISRQNR